MIIKKYMSLMFALLCLSSNIRAVKITDKGLAQIEKSSYFAVGYGTFPLKGQACKIALNRAIKLGYRIIDSATVYRNLDAIGDVLRKQKRSDFYIISKVWPDSHTPDRLRQDLKNTLKLLKASYLDCYFLHWPNSAVSIEETLKTLNELRTQGLIRHIGLSNVTVNHLKRALEVGVPITWVQVEMHPLFYDSKVLEFCNEKSIGVQAWSPLDRGRISRDAVLSNLGRKYGKSACQVAIRWILQHGCIPLPASRNPIHMTINKDVMDFTLSQEDMSAIDARAKAGKREKINGLGFDDEFDYSYEQCWPIKK